MCIHFLESSFHRLAPLKHVKDCKEGGFLHLQNNLKEGKLPSCKACQNLLQDRNFSMDGLQEALRQAEEDGQDAAEAPPGNGDAGREDRGIVPPARLRGDKEAEDPLAYARSFHPMIELLPPGEYGKKLPFRCKLCTSRAFPEGKVGDLIRMRADSVKYFLNSHFGSQLHQQNLQRSHDPLAEDTGSGTLIDRECGGLEVNNELHSGALGKIWQKEFDVWMNQANLEQFGKHKYWQTKTRHGSGWVIRASQCKKTVKADPELESPICRECLKLGTQTGVTKQVVRFSTKYYSAILLSARLFGGTQGVNEAEKEIRSGGLQQTDPEKVDELLTLSNDFLQQTVRGAWQHLPDGSQTDAYRQFFKSVVEPVLRYPVGKVPSCFADVIARAGAYLATGTATEADRVNLKIAAAALDGTLQHHPMLQGMALQCMRMLDKEQRSVSLVGRRSHESERERTLISDAGLRLAMACGNTKLGSLPLGLLMRNDW